MSPKNSQSETFFNHPNLVIMCHVQDVTITNPGGSAGDGYDPVNPTAGATYKTIKGVSTELSSVPQSLDLVGIDYDNVGLASLDSLFVPFYISEPKASHSYLPYWEEPTDSGSINSDDLNPYNPQKIFTPGGVFSPSVFYEKGHINMLSNTYTGVGNGTDDDLCTYNSIETKNDANYNHRVAGLKAPVVFTGWGYDINGNPVPSGEGGGFHDEAFNNPTIWKSGPLDMRWDNARKVWTIVGDGVIKHATVSSCIGSGYYVGKIGDWTMAPPSGAGDGDGCDPCELLPTGYNCGDITDVTITRPSPSGTGANVLLYDVRTIPLKIPGHAIVGLKTTFTPESGTVAYDNNITESWCVLEGEREIVAIPHEEYECCVDASGNQTVQLVSCTTFIVEGVKCETILTPCSG